MHRDCSNTSAYGKLSGWIKYWRSLSIWDGRRSNLRPCSATGRRTCVGGSGSRLQLLCLLYFLLLHHANRIAAGMRINLAWIAEPAQPHDVFRPQLQVCSLIHPGLDVPMPERGHIRVTAVLCFVLFICSLGAC